MLGTAIVLAGCTVAAALVTGARVFGLKRLVKYATVTDVLFTLGLFVVFAGTLTGALVAVLGGLMMAVLLTLLKGIDTQMQQQGRKLASRPPMWMRFNQAWKNTEHPLSDEIDRDGVWVYNKAPYV